MLSGDRGKPGQEIVDRMPVTRAQARDKIGRLQEFHTSGSSALAFRHAVSGEWDHSWDHRRFLRCSVPFLIDG